MSTSFLILKICHWCFSNAVENDSCDAIYAMERARFLRAATKLDPNNFSTFLRVGNFFILSIFILEKNRRHAWAWDQMHAFQLIRTQKFQSSSGRCTLCCGVLRYESKVNATAWLESVSFAEIFLSPWIFELKLLGVVFSGKSTWISLIKQETEIKIQVKTRIQFEVSLTCPTTKTMAAMEKLKWMERRCNHTTVEKILVSLACFQQLGTGEVWS